jgi:glycine/D-amino acid oxidase-like deaminating enzyme
MAAMIEREMDVVVVGAGIVGCATAYDRARWGVRVAAVERADIAGFRFSRFAEGAIGTPKNVP